MSLAAGEAKDAAAKAVADGKKVVDTTKGQFFFHHSFSGMHLDKKVLKARICFASRFSYFLVV